MDYGHFLPEYDEDSRLRLKLWNLFQKAEEEAKRFPENSGDWYEIVEINCLPGQAGGKWIWDNSQRLARIRFVPRWDDLGVIFHEVFHSAFHDSLLHGKIGKTKEKYDELWGDPFCDAFRYFMERQFLDYESSDWYRRMDNICRTSFDEGVQKYEGQFPYRGYLYPASLIINKAYKDYFEGFLGLWFRLLSDKHTQVGRPMLNEAFSYDIKAGKPISDTA